MIEIVSKHLCVQIDEEGAQLCSLFDVVDEVEYVWQRDAEYWASSSPVVFPVIGKLNQLQYQLDQKTYSMKSNGIIRYETLKVIAKGDTYVELLYVNEKNIQQYPYHCRFKIRYEVDGKTLIITSTIYNDDTKSMYYNYAGHPGFNIPLYESESCDDYYIEFEKRERLNIFEVCESGQLINSLQPFFTNEKRFFIRKQLFRKEALVFHHPESTCVSIKSLRHDKEIKVCFEGFDNLAIWSPYIEDKPLRFVCIEPWIGHTDFKNYAGDFTQRDEIACLPAGKQKTYSYTIQIHP